MAAGAPPKAPRRPRSAFGRPGPSAGKPPLGAVRGSGSWKGVEQMEALREMCVHLKRTANALSEDNMKVKTRMMSVGRELSRRERLLRELCGNTAGISMDLLERMREERNMLPIFKRKCASLANGLEERERAIASLKREPRFTRIVELETELGTWQAEIRRLDTLLSIPVGQLELSSVAQEEAEAHQTRAEIVIKNELATLERHRRTHETEMQAAKLNHQEVLSDFLDKEQELKKVQMNSRELAMEFKQLVSRLNEYEQLREHLQGLSVEKESHISRIQESKENIDALLRERSRRQTVSHNVLHQLGRNPDVADEGILELFGSLDANELRSWVRLGRRGACPCHDPSGGGTPPASGGLFREFQTAAMKATDVPAESGEGLAGIADLAKVLGRTSEEDGKVDDSWEEQISQILSRTPGLVLRDDHEPAPAAQGGKCRWLDLLVLLDRLHDASHRARPSPALPWNTVDGDPGLLSTDLIRRLRTRCLRQGVDAEDLRESITELKSVASCRAFFTGQLGLREEDVDRLCGVYEIKGSSGLLLRLPLSEAALYRSRRIALLARFERAAIIHKEELADGFGIWGNVQMLTPDQFRTICLDVLVQELSQREVEDLRDALLPPGAEFIDGEKLCAALERESGFVEGYRNLHQVGPGKP